MSASNAQVSLSSVACKFHELPCVIVSLYMNHYKRGLRFRMCMHELKSLNDDEYQYTVWQPSNYSTRTVRPSDIKMKYMEKILQKLDGKKPALYRACETQFYAIRMMAIDCEEYIAHIHDVGAYKKLQSEFVAFHQFMTELQKDKKKAKHEKM